MKDRQIMPMVRYRQRIPLTKARALFLRKGEGWRDSCLEKIIYPLLNGDLLQDDRRVASSRNTSCRLACVEGSPFFLKLYRPRRLLDKLYVLRKSRSQRAWEGGMLLIEKGFMTPSLIAQGDIIKGCFVEKTFLITGAIEGSLNLYEYLETFTKGGSIEKKREFFAAMGALIGRLHTAGIFHGDLRPGNVLVKASGEDIQFYFIDNERTKLFPGGIPLRLRIKNLVQINMIVMPQVTSSDRMRFFNAYLSENRELKTGARELMRRVSLRTRERLSKKIVSSREKDDGQN